MNASPDRHIHPPLESSERFASRPTRRDFLGLAAFWSAIGALVTATLGALRLPMPAVFPESNSTVKIGPPDFYLLDSATHLPEVQAWLFHTEDGFHAISSVCTHLGCIARREESGEFVCPCHGSRFGAGGKVKGGPAPKGLNWLEMSRSPDGQLVVDKVRTVPEGTHFVV